MGRKYEAYSDEDKRFLTYFVPGYGLYTFFKDRNDPCMREEVTVIADTINATGSRFGALATGLIPLQIMEAIGLYKVSEYLVSNPEAFHQIWKAIGDIGRYAFST